MLQGKLEMDNGIVMMLGTEHGSFFNLDPLTSVPINISSSQGFQQRGVTFHSASVGGVSRELSGCFIGSSARSDAVKLCRALSPLSSGKFYIGSTVYAEFVVEKSPELTYLSHDCVEFDSMLFFASPDYYSIKSISADTGGYTPAFSYSTTLDSHTFATLGNSMVTVDNPGDLAARLSIKFTALRNAASVQLVNYLTLEKIKINCALLAGETIDCYWRNNQFHVYKSSTNIFNSVDDDSTLFEIAAGSSVLTTGDDYVVASIDFRPVYNIIPEAEL